MDKVIVYLSGITSCSVCVEGKMSINDIENEVNIVNPTGINSKWKISKDKTFSDGKHTNPCTCDQYKTRKHYLLNC
jgi:hypothetical protein